MPVNVALNFPLTLVLCCICSIVDARLLRKNGTTISQDQGLHILDASSLETMSVWQQGVEGWAPSLASSGVIVTVTNYIKSAIDNLCNPRCRAPTMILKTSADWPGNLFRIKAYLTLAEALPESSTILFTDCCDVLLRPNFDLFHKYSKLHKQQNVDVVIAATRSYAMATFDAGIRPAPGQKRVRYRPHNHGPHDFLSNTIQAQLGVRDICVAGEPLCSQNKFANAGQVIGTKAAAVDFYSHLWQRCDRCQSWEKSEGKNNDLKNTSDQNELSDYLVLSRYCGGKCYLDYGMELFHLTTGYNEDDYNLSPDGQLMLRLPGLAKADFSLHADIIHASGGSAAAVAVFKKIKHLVDPARPDTYWSPDSSM